MSNLPEDPNRDEVPAELRSSFGDNSPSETPKDVAPQDAASRDIVERKIASSDPEERVEALLDDAVEMTFPASDPLAINSVAKRMR